MCTHYQNKSFLPREGDTGTNLTIKSVSEENREPSKVCEPKGPQEERRKGLLGKGWSSLEACYLGNTENSHPSLKKLNFIVPTAEGTIDLRNSIHGHFSWHQLLPADFMRDEGTGQKPLVNGTSDYRCRQQEFRLSANPQWNQGTRTAVCLQVEAEKIHSH